MCVLTLARMKPKHLSWSYQTTVPWSKSPCCASRGELGFFAVFIGAAAAPEEEKPVPSGVVGAPDDDLAGAAAALLLASLHSMQTPVTLST